MIGPNVRMLPPLLYSAGSLKTGKFSTCFHRELYETSRNSFPLLMTARIYTSYRHIMEPEHSSPNFVSAVRYVDNSPHKLFIPVFGFYMPVTCPC